MSMMTQSGCEELVQAAQDALDIEDSSAPAPTTEVCRSCSVLMRFGLSPLFPAQN